MIAYWQPLCLLISLIPPKCSANLVTGFGRKNSKVTIDSSGLSSNTIEAAKQTLPAMGSWQVSTAQPGRSAARIAIASQVKQLGLDVRAGVHTGEVQVMGDNIGHAGAHCFAGAE